MRSKSRLEFLIVIPALLIVSSCHRYDPKRDHVWETPFPADSLAALIQKTIDEDSTAGWWLDPVTMVQAYIEQTPFAGGLDRKNIRPVSRTMRRITMEAILPEDSLGLILEMKRCFPEKGRKSLFQIIEVKPEKWPKPSA